MQPEDVRNILLAANTGLSEWGEDDNVRRAMNCLAQRYGVTVIAEEDECDGVTLTYYRYVV